MERIYIPYKKNKPAIVEVNGHELLVVASDKDALRSSQLIDSDSFKEVDAEGPYEVEFLFSSLEPDFKAGVVFAPDDVETDEFITILSGQLPWVH